MLKHRGEALIGDLRRDAPRELKDELVGEIDSWLMRWGLRHSFSEAYTRDEALGLLAWTSFSDYKVTENGIGLDIAFRKSPHQRAR